MYTLEEITEYLDKGIINNEVYDTLKFWLDDPFCKELYEKYERDLKKIKKCPICGKETTIYFSPENTQKYLDLFIGDVAQVETYVCENCKVTVGNEVFHCTNKVPFVGLNRELFK